ncbi:hypothetical protein PHET_03889 [Paragonimus heterotremus]|uniref:Fas-binding factor 1 C-terminal domain-containing protein n=1 Tax=Paragonimus heterotremus TaxID=100268 RepID=A0A8J4TG20_9TREM|nr:hypothetical protein PHET_03889 [Paragonimus heterotremus]
MACQKETQVLGDLQPNAEALKRLLEQLTNTTTELNRTEQERLRELTIRQEQVVRREEAVRAVEERIAQREEDLERERKQIVDAIAKLEFQTKENSKLMSEDRWTLKQEHNRLAKLQVGLEEERRGLVEQAGRERAEIQQLVANFLAEHRKTQINISEERAKIADEHQRLRVDQLAWEEKRRTEESLLRQAKEDVDAMKETLAAEHRRLDERTSKLRIDEVKLDETRRQLEIVRFELAREQEALTERNKYLTDQTAELARRSHAITQAEKALVETETRQRNLKQEQQRELAELQARAERVHEAEQKLTIERKELAKQHAELVQARQQANVTDRSNVLCTNCRKPVRERTNNTRKQPEGMAALNRRAVLTKNGLRASMLSDHVLLRQLRASQDEDSQFLEEEKRYLQRIKNATNELSVQ